MDSLTKLKYLDHFSSFVIKALKNSIYLLWQPKISLKSLNYNNF